MREECSPDHSKRNEYSNLDIRPLYRCSLPPYSVCGLTIAPESRRRSQFLINSWLLQPLLREFNFLCIGYLIKLLNTISVLSQYRYCRNLPTPHSTITEAIHSAILHNHKPNILWMPTHLSYTT